MHKKLFNRSIQFIITVSFTIITVVSIMVVGMTLYNKFTRIAVQNASASTTQIIEQVNLNLNYYIKSMIEVSSLLDQNIVKNQGKSNDQLKNQMEVIMKTKQDIVTMELFSEDGKLITGLPYTSLKKNVNIKEQQWFSEAMRNPNRFFFSPPHVQNLFPGQHNWVLSLSKTITVGKGDEKFQEVLLVDMNFHAIGELCQTVNLGKKGYIYIVDSGGNIVYHPQQQLIYNGLKYENNDDVLKHSQGSFIQNLDGEKRLITVAPVNYTDWKIVGVSYMEEITSIKNEITNFVVPIIIFGIILVVIISVLISAKISRPIKQLEQSMKKVEEGNFDINLDIKGEDEVVKLSNTFNMMVARIRELMEQIVHEQEAKRKSELNALQSQINPHFLYNTLDSIVWMAENGNSEDVITMVTALAKFFRISISRGKNIISVKEELEHAKNYLIIQKFRYKNKFRFEFEAEEETLKYKTLKLILQPIIENSIYHGIEYMMDEGVIKVSVQALDGKLLFKVSDNGLGMKKEILDNILSNQPKDESGHGVGVKNVHERIQLCYGKEYGLKIESEIEVGTVVKIWLPIVQE